MPSWEWEIHQLATLTLAVQVHDLSVNKVFCFFFILTLFTGRKCPSSVPHFLLEWLPCGIFFFLHPLNPMTLFFTHILCVTAPIWCQKKPENYIYQAGVEVSHSYHVTVCKERNDPYIYEWRSLTDPQSRSNFFFVFLFFVLKEIAFKKEAVCM